MNEHINTLQRTFYKKACSGYKSKLLINTMVMENCKTRKENPSTSWIDYRKAFNSVPLLPVIKNNANV